MMASDATKRSHRFESATDTELASAANSGDETARRELITRLLTPIRRTMSYLVRPAEDAEDLAQTAFIKILTSLSTFRGECAIEFWAKRIAIRVAAKHFKKRKRRTELAEAVWTPAKPQESMDDQMDHQLIRARISALLQRLTFEKRTAVVLHFVEGYTAAEVAEMTGVPIGTARDRLLRGRAQLKKKLTRDPVVTAWFQKRKK